MQLIHLYDRDKLVAKIDLVDGELRVIELVGNWVAEFMEELRGDRTDEELFNSLPMRLRGHLWVGTPIEK